MESNKTLEKLLKGFSENTKKEILKLMKENMKEQGIEISFKQTEEKSIGKQLADEKKSESKAQKAQKDFFTSETKQDDENWGF